MQHNSRFYIATVTAKLTKHDRPVFFFLRCRCGGGEGKRSIGQKFKYGSGSASRGGQKNKEVEPLSKFTKTWLINLLTSIHAIFQSCAQNQTYLIDFTSTTSSIDIQAYNLVIDFLTCTVPVLILLYSFDFLTCTPHWLLPLSSACHLSTRGLSTNCQSGKTIEWKRKI